jgi:1,4-alpha-glucan branching enzyme
MKRILLMSAFLLTQIIGYSFNVTFQVDMNNVTQGFTTPEINGTMNGWCGGCAAMTDANGDNVWEITIDLAAGTYEYKFAADGWNIQENLIPGGSCTLTTGSFTNRVITVSADTTLDVVCWGTCSACGIEPSSHDVTFRVDMNNVTEAFTTPEVNGTFNGWCGGCAPMSDADGDGIWEITINLLEGNHEYKFAADGWNIQESLTEGASCTINGAPFVNRSLSVTAEATLDAVCWGACTPCNVVVPTYDVTFRVDMNNVTETFTTPEVNGTFNGWCGGCAPMADVDGDGIWELTITLDEGSYEYKFAADAWNIQESLTEGSPCTISADGFTNRALNLNADVTLDAVCWGSCNACNVVAPSYDVTFRVDMNNVTDAFTTPEVNGTFNGWCGGCAPMSDVDGDGIWELTISLEEGNYEYKFAYDSWAGSEQLTEGDPCTVGGAPFVNRTLAVTSDATLDAVCWGSCNACNVVVPSYDVTFRVDMNNVTDAFTTPEVNGTFNGWCGGCAPMSDVDGDGIWELTISLEEGNYEYKFAADGWNIQESLTEGNPCTVGVAPFVNRTLAVTSDATLDAVCWGSCNACNVVVPSYDVTFRVDMNDVTTAFTTPEVNGTFNGWCGGCAPMSDVDGDNVWELTIPLEAGTYEYKFAADGWNIQESLTEGDPCTINAAPFINRTLNVTGNTDQGLVCWGSCSECDGGGGGGTAVNVTFQVNMAQVTDVYTAPEVNGTFNGWCGGCAPMTDADGDNIWEITIALEPGSYEYKFAADTWNIQENLPAGSSCTITTGAFTNRTLVVTDGTTLPVVCWGSCSDCGQSTGPYNVTFKVDMSEVTAAYTTPEVNGTFNNWCGGCAPMSDVDGDDVWELTISLPVGSYEYKFAYDAWAGQEELTPGSLCLVTLDGFTNRSLTVSETAVLDAVCWASCEVCDVAVNELINGTFAMYPNPAGDNITMNFEGLSFKPTSVKITNAIGQTVHVETLTHSNQKTISTERFENGVYFVTLSSGEFTTTQKIMVQH